MQLTCLSLGVFYSLALVSPMAMERANVTPNPGFELYVNTLADWKFKLFENMDDLLNIPENVRSLVLSHKDETV